MPLPLTVCCFSEIQIGFTFLVLAHLGIPEKRAVKRVCVCVCYLKFVTISECIAVVQVTEHIGPVAKAGGGGSGSVSFKQPVGVAVGRGAGGEVYVLDAGNSRVAVLDGAGLRQRRCVAGVPGLEERGAVGLALRRGGESMVVVNWRTRQMTELMTTTSDVHNPVVRQVSQSHPTAL